MITSHRLWELKVNLLGEKLLLPPPQERSHVLGHGVQVELAEALPHQHQLRGPRLG